MNDGQKQLLLLYLLPVTSRSTPQAKPDLIAGPGIGAHPGENEEEKVHIVGRNWVQSLLNNAEGQPVT